MPEKNDMELVRDYVRGDSEPAFAELVHKHVNLVYSVALRYVGNSQDAQDVTQAVFIILARKAARLGERTVLTGWLYETTRFTALRLLRDTARRQIRERNAHMQSTLNEPNTDNAWQQLAPLLEEAMSRLSQKERALLALRFFENKNTAESANLLGIQEEAARKRAQRAVEKLRTFFMRRGIKVSAAVLTGAISANSVQAAPVGLAKSIVTVAAVSKGSAASGSILTLIKGALKLMAWAKAKTALTVGAAVLLAVGVVTVTVEKVAANSTNHSLPPEVHAQLEKQKAALQSIYLTYAQTETGSRIVSLLGNSTYSNYFKGPRFYEYVQSADPDREFAFDGKIVYEFQHKHPRGFPASLKKYLIADKTDPMRLYNKFMFPYLDAAGIYAPAYSDEVEHFSGLEPLVLHYLAEGDSPKVETIGDNVRVTFQVNDRWLANARQFDVEQVRKQADNGANTPAFVAREVENVKRWQAMNPTRTVALLLDAKHGYAVAEREEWTAAGQRIVRVVSDDWQYYAVPGIWLPGRCVASYYTHPLFLAEFSDERIATVTHQLQRVEFGKKDIPFALQGSSPTPGKPAMRIVDRTPHTRSTLWIYAAITGVAVLIAAFAIRWSRSLRRNS